MNSFSPLCFVRWVLSSRFGFSPLCDFLDCSKFPAILWSLGRPLPVTERVQMFPVPFISLSMNSRIPSSLWGSHFLSHYTPKPGSSSSPLPPPTQSPGMLICSPGKGGISSPSRGSIWPCHSLFKGTRHTTENKKNKPDAVQNKPTPMPEEKISTSPRLDFLKNPITWMPRPSSCLFSVCGAMRLCSGNFCTNWPRSIRFFDPKLLPISRLQLAQCTLHEMHENRRNESKAVCF